jgi:hypothetical protein
MGHLQACGDGPQLLQANVWEQLIELPPPLFGLQPEDEPAAHGPVVVPGQLLA